MAGNGGEKGAGKVSGGERRKEAREENWWTSLGVSWAKEPTESPEKGRALALRGPPTAESNAAERRLGVQEAVSRRPGGPASRAAPGRGSSQVAATSCHDGCNQVAILAPQRRHALRGSTRPIRSGPRSRLGPTPETPLRIVYERLAAHTRRGDGHRPACHAGVPNEVSDEGASSWRTQW